MTPSVSAEYRFPQWLSIYQEMLPDTLFFKFFLKIFRVHKNILKLYSVITWSVWVRKIKIKTRGFGEGCQSITLASYTTHHRGNQEQCNSHCWAHFQHVCHEQMQAVLVSGLVVLCLHFQISHMLSISRRLLLHGHSWSAYSFIFNRRITRRAVDHEFITETFLFILQSSQQLPFHLCKSKYEVSFRED